MNIGKLQELIINNEGIVFSSGTLNIQHTLSKAYDVIQEYNLSESLKNEILSIFVLDLKDEFVMGESLFIEQFYGYAHIHEQKYYEGQGIWNEDVFQLFNSISPDGYSFTSQDGDGSCIGWFKIEDSEAWD